MLKTKTREAWLEEDLSIRGNIKVSSSGKDQPDTVICAQKS